MVWTIFISAPLYFNSEAVALRCCLKKVFLKISQNSQRNIVVGVSFLISCRPRPATLLKKRLQHSCFLVSFAKIFSNNLFYKTPPVASYDSFQESIHSNRKQLICNSNQLTGFYISVTFACLKLHLSGFYVHPCLWPQDNDMT